MLLKNNACLSSLPICTISETRSNAKYAKLNMACKRKAVYLLCAMSRTAQMSNCNISKSIGVLLSKVGLVFLAHDDLNVKGGCHVLYAHDLVKE